MKKFTACILVLVFVSSMIPVSLLLSTQNAKAGTPDDGVNGVQYIDGDWIVSSPENYTDEVIILSGNLTVENGGSLLLKNVTLAMNCSFNGQFHIRVNTSGSLTVTDGDNNPWTTDDFSNITDSPFDNDGGGGDYKYYVEVMSGGSVSINNTIIRECGYNNDPRYGFYVYSDTSSFENSIFKSNFHGLILEGNNSEIRNCTFNGNKEYGIRSIGNDNIIFNCSFNNNLDYGFLSSGNGNNIQNCIFINNYYAIWIDSGGLDNDIQECTFENNTNGIRVQGDNTEVHNCTLKNNDKSIYVATDVNNTDIQDCTFENDKIGSNNYGITIYSAKNFTIGHSEINYCRDGIITTAGTKDGNIYHNEVHHCDYGMTLAGSNLIINNNTVHNNTDVYDTVNPGQSGILLDSLQYSDIFNNTLENNGVDSGASDRFNLYVQSCDNLKIHDNTIQKIKLYGTSVNISSSSNIDFYYNNVTNNSGIGIFVELGGSDTNIRIHNNNISNNTPIGLEVVGTTTTYVEIKENVLIDNGNTVVDHKSRGIGLHLLQDYTITGNTINSNTGDPTRMGDAVWINEVYGGDFSNNTMDGNPNDLYLDELDTGFEFSDFYVVNCTFSTSKVGFWDPFAPFLHIQNYLHVRTFDMNGSLPYVDISVKNKDSVEVQNVQTDIYGGVWYLKVINQSIESLFGPTYFDPHNITGTYDIYTAYGEIEPVMDTTRMVNVYFNIDTPPQPPTNLVLERNLTNIDLTWMPSPSKDLHHYLVFRNTTGPGWIEIYNSSFLPLPQRKWTNWTDIDAASSWATYSYRVQAVDNASQGSELTNIAKCGDWVVSDTQIVENLTVLLNGSLTVLPTGNLTLSNVTIQFNNSYLLEYGIEVKPGGDLYILDSDNNPLTTEDQSNLSALTPTKNFYFIMNGSKFEMRNSKISDCGSKQSLDFGYWGLSEGEKVMSVGAPWKRGLYISGASEVVIENNIFTNNFVSLLMNEIDNKAIDGNSFSNNVFGIYLNNSSNNSINNNIFSNHQGFPIYLFNSENNTISSNDIENIAGTPGGIVLYDAGSNFNKMFDNIVTTSGQDTAGPYGICIYYAGVGNNATNNTIIGHERGIYINSSDSSILLENKFSKSLHYDCLLEFAPNTLIQGGLSNGSNYSYYINMSNNVKISDITIENASYGIFDWYCNVLTLADIYLYSCENGTNIFGGDTIVLSNITINGSDYAIYDWHGNNINLTDVSIKSCNNGIIIFGGDTVLLKNITIEDCNYGITSESDPLNIELHDSQIFGNVQYALKIGNCGNFIIYNGTLNASLYNFDLISANINLYNTTYNQTRVKLDSLSSISLYWPLDAKVVDWEGDPIFNANVQIRNSTETLVYNGYSNANGFIRWIWLYERIQYPNTNWTYIPYTILAIYGNHSGQKTLMVNRSIQTTVIVKNLAPSVSNVMINPLYPTTIDDLNLSYQYYDPEDNPEGNTSIKWFVDGVHNQSFNNQTLISNVSTSKDQTWYCEVRPHDGSVYGLLMISTPVTIQNTPPVVSNVKINETDPTSSDNLHVNFTFWDVDGDSNIQSQYRWYVDNGTGWIYSGVDALELDASYTKKGEMWKCNVTPNDHDSLGISKESPFVVIGNTAPEASNVIIKPTSPQSNETLTANYTYFDLDGDSKSGCKIRWYKNGSLQTDLNDSETVDPSLTLKGEVWYYIITPSDGEDNGTPVQSESTNIENTPPTVSNITISPSNPTTEDRLYVSYDFFDNDNDNVDRNNTVVKWLRWADISKEFFDTGYRGHNLSSEFTKKGEIWMCLVIPHDGKDLGISNLSSMNVTIINSAPTVSNVIITPSNPNAETNLSTSYIFNDVDSDSESIHNISWYKNETLQVDLYDSKTVHFSYTRKSEIWYYIIKPYDGENYGIQVKSENITIGNTPPTVSNITISPLSPTTEDRLYVSYDFNDTDGDSEDKNNTVVKWLRWDEIVKIFFDTGFRGHNLSSEFTKKGEIWICEIIPHDGQDLGISNLSGKNVTIINSAPSVSNVIISPSNPNAESNLSVSYVFYDADSDSESIHNISWYKNETLQADLNDSKTVHFSYTLKGEVWYYLIKPYDGEEYGDLVKSENITIGNTPPRAYNITISPLNPTTEDDLIASFDFNDTDGDTQSLDTVIKWLRWIGSGYLDTGLRGKTLPSSYISKGERWTCEVVPHDGENEGLANRSSMNVTIINSPPSVSNIIIAPSNPNAESNLSVSYVFYDADSDSESVHNISWYKNKTLQFDLNDSKTVHFSYTLKGEIWYYLIEPYDGEEYGDLVKSENITIGNTPPRAYNITISPLNPTTEDDLIASFDFNDTDGDTQSLDTVIKWLRWSVSDFFDTGFRGQTLPSTYTSKGDRWTCEVVPHDGENEGPANRSNMNVTIINSAPSVSNVNITPSNPNAESNLSTNYMFDDADGDSESVHNISWYKNETLQVDLNDSKTVHFSYTLKGEVWYYLIKPYDGENYGTIVKSKNITIGNTPPRANNITISPLNPTTEDDLIASFDFNDTDGDTQSLDTVIKWLRWIGGGYLDTGLRGKTLPSSYTSKDERWTCEVVPHDGENEGPINRSIMNVTIINSAPTVSNPIITPLNPTADSNLTANYTFLDPDDDIESGSTIRWFRNDVEQIDLIGNKTVHFSRTQSEDEWYYIITPYDGEVYGTPVQSELLIIGNTPPRVSNITIAPLNPKTGNDLTVDYDFYDSDGDDESNNTIVKWLLWSGAVFYDTGYTGKTLFSAYTTKDDIWTCQVIPHDGQDFGTAKTSNMNAMIINSPPVITRASSIPVNPISESDINVDYDFFDPDGDPEIGSTIQWFRNDIEQFDLVGSLIVDSSRTLKDDIWYYNITTSDGENIGITVQSDNIIVGNTPPQVSNIGISPLVPTTEEDLVVDYDFLDSDGDTESGDTIIKWLRWTGIQFVDTGYRGKTLPSAFTLKEERWKCEVTPHDGFDYGISLEWSSNVTIINSKPVVSDLYITPTDPKTTSTLVASYLYSDVDYDLENGTWIRWYLNDVHEPTLDNQTFASSSFVIKGDFWYFTVEPNDGTEFGSVVASEAIEILNSPPTAQDLSISPENPSGNDNLTAQYTFDDEDSDFELPPEVRWYKNGILQISYNDQLVVDSSATVKNQLWYFILRVFDGEDYGEEINSPYVEVENSMPVVNSITPTPGQIVINETESIEFFVDADDPDGDVMSYKWKVGPATVGDGDYYKFSTDYISIGEYYNDGTYTLNLSIQDYGARSFTLYREWEITVINMNRIPKISSTDPVEKELNMEEDTSLQFSIVADDDDGDTLKINWTFDGNYDVPVQVGGSTYTYYADHAAAGEHVVTAIVDDGTDTVEYSWNLTVEDVKEEAREELWGHSFDWWGLVLAVFSGIAAMVFAVFGLVRMRKKKGALKRYMAEINEISSDSEQEPGEFDEKMDDVESRLNAEFQKGKIEDLHFHMLEDAIVSRRRNFRKAEVSEKFEGLPKWITQEMEGMLKDGKISRTEYEGFVSIISKTEALTPKQKEELSEMVEEWEDEDKEPAEEDIGTDEDIDTDEMEEEEIEEKDTDDEIDFDEESNDKTE